MTALGHRERGEDESESDYDRAMLNVARQRVGGEGRFGSYSDWRHENPSVAGLAGLGTMTRDPDVLLSDEERQAYRTQRMTGFDQTRRLEREQERRESGPTSGGAGTGQTTSETGASPPETEIAAPETTEHSTEAQLLSRFAQSQEDARTRQRGSGEAGPVGSETDSSSWAMLDRRAYYDRVERGLEPMPRRGSRQWLDFMLQRFARLGEQ